VPVPGLPPIKEVGLTVTLERVAGETVSVAVSLTPPKLAVINAETGVASPVVDIVNVVLIVPAAIVTLAGTVAAVLEDARLTVVPPGPARPFKVMVPVDELPPTTVVSESEIACSAAGPMVNVAVCAEPAMVAVIVASVDEDTADVVTENVAEVAPWFTMIDAGTEAEGLLDDRFKVAELAPTGEANDTVPITVLPPRVVFGERIREVSGGKLSTLATKPEKIIAPQPEAVSQPTVAFDVKPFGKSPLLPDVIS